MIRSPLHPSIFILIALFLAACGSRPTPLPSAIVLTDAPTRTALPTTTATPSPGLFTAIHSQITYVPTRTPTPTKTHTVAPTTTSTFVPTLPPATPAAGPDRYRLKVWTEPEAHAALAEGEQTLTRLRASDIPSSAPYSEYEFEEYLITVEREAAHRFPDMASTTSLYWQLGAHETYAWNYIYPVEDFRLALETTLNSGAMTFSQLGDWLTRYNYYLQVEAVYTTTNLFGDGQTAIIFQVGTYDAQSGGFILTGSLPGDYHVTAIHEDWYSTYHRGERITVTDLNGNGQPEISRIYSISGFLGGPFGFCVSQLALYEWRGPYPGGQFLDLARNIPEIRFDGLYIPDCDTSWEFGPAYASGTQPIYSVSSRYPGDSNLKCIEDERRTIYQWNGTFYEWAGEHINPASNAHSPACAALWAKWAGGMSAEATTFMAAALDNWPTEIEQVRGPTAQDDFRFKLGTWYALRGETELAQSTLQTVRDHPVNPQATDASQMARAYLINYQTNHSPFLACSAAIQALEALHPELLSDMNWTNPWPYDVCDMHEAFQQTIGTFQPHTTADLLDWFREQDIGVGTVNYGDINRDGVGDWLGVINLRHRADLWAFISSDKGLQAILVEDYLGGEGIFATFTQVPAETDSAPINVFTRGDWTTAFQIIEREGLFAAMPYPSSLLPVELQPPLDRYEKFASAEKALLQTGDTASALKQLRALTLDNNINHTPSFLYLLGLAHELSGHVPEAVQAYWQLWHDYPDSPYTLMARRKLEMIRP